MSFAQFEREIIGERIRDKKLATARQGKYIGGQPKLGLDIVDRRYVINEDEAKLVRRIFKLLLELESCRKVAEKLNAEGIRTKRYKTKTGKEFGGSRFSGRNVYDIVTDQKYLGKIVHKGIAYDGEHKAIVTQELVRFSAAGPGRKQNLHSQASKAKIRIAAKNASLPGVSQPDSASLDLEP